MLNFLTRVPRTGRRAAVLLTALFVLFNNVQAAQQTVRVGVYQNNPKVFEDEHGVAKGIFIDLIQAVAKEEHWRLEFVPGTWTEGLDRLTRGEIDLMPDVSFSAEREKRWAFNKEAVLSDWFQIVCPKSNPITSILDLTGKKVAVLQNSVQQETLASAVYGFSLDVDIVPMPDYDQGLDMIKSGQADLLVANRYLAVHLDNSTELEDSPVVFNPTRLHFAAPMEGRRPLLDALDRHLVHWKEDPKSIYYTTLKRWTGESPKIFIPLYVKYCAIVLGGILLLIAGVALLLRWQVRARTAELRKKTSDLETALRGLQDTQNKAEQQERLHALGQMASGIAHDFNNILTPIIGLSDLLLTNPKQLENTETARKHLVSISKAGRDGAEIVKRMKSFYRTYEPEKSRPIDPGKAVEDVIELSRPRWQQGDHTGRQSIHIDTQIEKGLRILVHEPELREALMNLLLNSVDAMPEGGTVTLSVKKENNTVVICVKDTGSGMSKDVREKCLTAFYTTKGQDGTGMGLPMVKSMCDRYGARLQIDSGEDQGTAISLIFLLYNQSEPVEHPVVPPKKIRPLNILVVDDEHRSLDVLESVLIEAGHHVIAYVNPGEALKKACADKFDLVITDRNMPGLSGEDLARSIRALPAAPPVILLTGSTGGVEPAEQEQVYVLLKPLDIYRLNRLLAEIGFDTGA